MSGEGLLPFDLALKGIETLDVLFFHELQHCLRWPILRLVAVFSLLVLVDLHTTNHKSRGALPSGLPAHDIRTPSGD